MLKERVKLKDVPSDPSPASPLHPSFWQTAGWSCAASENAVALDSKCCGFGFFPLFWKYISENI